MSSRRAWYGAKAKPTPVGAPSVEYRRYTFGQMKPIPTGRYNFQFDNTKQLFIDARIPANYWADKHTLILTFGFLSHFADHSEVDPVYVDEYYNIQDLGYVVQGGGDDYAGTGTTGMRTVQMQFFRQGDFIFDMTPFVNSSHQSVGRLMTSIQWQECLPPETPVDFTQQMALQIYLQSTNAIEGDNIECLFAKTYIESPLQLNRYT